MTITNFNRLAIAAAVGAFAFPAAALAQDIEDNIEDFGEQMEIAAVEKADAVIASRLETLEGDAPEGDDADAIIVVAQR